MKDIYLWAGPETCLWLLMQSTLDMGLYWENKIDFVDQTTMLVTLKRMQVDKVKFWRSFRSFWSDWNSWIEIIYQCVKGIRVPFQKIETIRCKIALLWAQFLNLILSQTFCSLCLNSDYRRLHL